MFYKIANQFKKPGGLLGRLVSKLMIKGNKHAYDTIIGEMQLTSEHKVLEIGYGPGAGIRDIFKKVSPAEFLGIDFSQLMFEKASKLNKAIIDSVKVKLLYGDFLTTQFEANHFDKVFCLNVVYFWEEPVVPFKKIWSLLKEDGKFYFYMSSKEDLDRLKFTDDDVFNKHTIEKVTADLKLAGFSEIKHFYKYGYFVEGRK